MIQRPPRVKLRAQIGVLRDGRRELANLEDASAQGVRLSGLANLRCGEIVRLHALGAILEAEVRWVSQTGCGLKFTPTAPAGEIRRFCSRALRPDRRSPAAQLMPVPPVQSRRRGP
ncbi:MAG: PilZ domain-containing protein [Roseinatronobacter sp.]